MQQMKNSLPVRPQRLSPWCRNCAPRCVIQRRQFSPEMTSALCPGWAALTSHGWVFAQLCRLLSCEPPEGKGRASFISGSTARQWHSVQRLFAEWTTQRELCHTSAIRGLLRYPILETRCAQIILNIIFRFNIYFIHLKHFSKDNVSLLIFPHFCLWSGQGLMRTPMMGSGHNNACKRDKDV